MNKNMNEKALNDAYRLFTGAGYSGNITDFTNLISSNTNAFNDAYNLFSQAGYGGNKEEFLNLVGLGKAQGSTEDPTMSQVSMGSDLDDGSSDSVSWFDQTWFGRGIKAASTTGEATDLMSENFSNISAESIQEFMRAKENESKSYVESERMKKFQKKQRLKNNDTKIKRSL